MSQPEETTVTERELREWEAREAAARLVRTPVFQGLSEQQLVREGMAPLAAWAVRRGEPEPADEADVTVEAKSTGHGIDSLQLVMMRTLVWWEVQLKVVRGLECSCDGAGIRIAFLKGTDLNLRCYPEPGIRPMADVDLLVDGSNSRRMAAVLKELGYRRLDADDAPAVHLAFQTRWSNPHGRVMVEVHTAPDWSEAIGVSTGELLERSVRVEGDTIRVLDGPDMLMNVATHAVRDMRAAWRRPVVDACYALASLQMPWERVVERARAWKARPALYALLARARAFAGAEVPYGVLRQLDTAGVSGRLARWLGGCIDLPAALQSDWPERWVRLGMMESAGGRAKFAARYARLRLRDRLVTRGKK